MVDSDIAGKTYSIKGGIIRKQLYTFCNFPFLDRQETGITRVLGRCVANRLGSTDEVFTNSCSDRFIQSHIQYHFL